MFYLFLKCCSEDIDEEALLFGTPMYLPTAHLQFGVVHLAVGVDLVLVADDVIRAAGEPAAPLRVTVGVRRRWEVVPLDRRRQRRVRHLAT